MKKHLKNIIFFLLVLASFICINYAATTLWEESYVDLSTNKSYTLSSATKNIINNLQGEQTIDLYQSTEIARDYPQTAQYAEYIKDLLQRYAKQSSGKINLNIIKVKPFSEEEKSAFANGLKAFSDAQKKINLFFGAVIYNSNGEKRVIPNFVEYRRAYAEKDISENIYWLDKGGKRAKIGLIAPDIDLKYSTTGLLDKNTNLNIFNKLSAEYDIQPISEYAVQIGVYINTLIVINPAHSFAQIGQYALDQFLLRGGNLIIFVDAVNEKTHQVNNDEGLNKLLNHWGINYTSAQTIGNIDYAEDIILNNKITKYQPWMSLTPTAFNQDSALMRGLNIIRTKSPAGLEIISKNRKAVKVTPLISLNKHNEVVDSTLVVKNYKMLVPQELKTTDQKYNIALLLEGKFSSMFTQNIMEGTKVAPQMLPFLPQSMEQGRVFVISDIDILWDENYVDTSFAGQNAVYGSVPWANNGDLIERIVNMVNNDNKLLGLTSKPILPPKGLEYQFMQEAQKHYAPQINTLEERLQQYQKQQNNYNSQDTSLGDIQQQKQLAENITQTQQQLQQINYQIDRMQNAKKRNFVILNIVLILILLTALAAKFKSAQKSRKFMPTGEK